MLGLRPRSTGCSTTPLVAGGWECQRGRWGVRMLQPASPTWSRRWPVGAPEATRGDDTRGGFALDLAEPRTVHIVGVGGAGMSAIATVLARMGHTVSGSDLRESRALERLA